MRLANRTANRYYVIMAKASYILLFFHGIKSYIPLTSQPSKARLMALTITLRFSIECRPALLTRLRRLIRRRRKLRMP